MSLELFRAAAKPLPSVVRKRRMTKIRVHTTRAIMICDPVRLSQFSMRQLFELDDAVEALRRGIYLTLLRY